MLKDKIRPILWPLLLCVPLGILGFCCKYVLVGYSFSALVCLCLIGLILFYTLMPFVTLRFPKFGRIVTRGVTAVVVIGFLICAVTEGLILHASLGSGEEPVDYVVVLGAKVNADGPSVSLWDRICGAYTYLEEHPNVVAVVSGGQGTDEPITEAECMYRELVSLGIDPHRVWVEDQATSTWENLQFSLNLIEEKTGTRPQKLGVLSSEYHLFRASLLADACHVEFVGIPAQTSRLAQKVNHYMREVAGVWHYILLEHRYH